MKVLVTGALGFIGSNLTERLLQEGHEVYALDNLHTGSEENISGIREKIRIFSMGSGEIGKTGEKFDVIFHQGIYSSSPMYKKDPHLTAKVIEEWISILEYAKENGTRIVFASSSSVYNGNEVPYREDMEVKIMDFYTEARYAMERLAKLYNDFYSVSITGLRYFSVYGPHERSKKNYANLITQFLLDMKEDRQPLIFGDGSQTRDFIFVDDVVEANILAMNSGKDFGIYNVGTGRSVSLNEMLKMLNQKLGKNIEPVYQENKIKNYVQQTQADTSKAESELGFRARISLEEGIDRLIKYYS